MIKFVIVVALIVLLGLFVLFRGTGEHFVRVTGYGSVRKAPDEASVTIGNRSENITRANLSTEQSANAAQFTRILDTIRGIAPAAKIETRSFLVAPSYNNNTNNNNQPAPELYTIYSSANVLIKGADQLSLLAQIIDQAIAAGSNSVGDVQYSLSDEARKSASDEAQGTAIQDASAKANRLAGLAKRILGPVQQIIDNDSPVRLFRAELSASPPDASTTTPLLPPQEIQIDTQLTVQYVII